MFPKVVRKNDAAAAEPSASRSGSAHIQEGTHEGAALPALARAAVETFVRERRLVSYNPGSHTPLLSRPSACFVSIKTDRQELRGCVGTIEPAKSALAEEIIANAVSAATQDPRFSPVGDSELRSLTYSVDVLDHPEPASFEQLDPKIYGVIVEDEISSRRGLLLPDIEGIETPAQQVQIAARKAGISLHNPCKLYRFRVRRFGEQAHAEQFSEQGD